MRLFRLTSRAYANIPLSGVGAALAGARWNSKGTRMGYTASSRALALLELFAHLTPKQMPVGHVIIPLDVPDDAVIDLDLLPSSWERLPYQPNVQAVGDAWITDATSLALRVPSAIVREEHNVLINPLHGRSGEIVLHAPEPVTWDNRLFT